MVIRESKKQDLDHVWVERANEQLIYLTLFFLDVDTDNSLRWEEDGYLFESGFSQRFFIYSGRKIFRESIFLFSRNY